jgi:uncharacterized membrane-anchored protein
MTTGELRRSRAATTALSGLSKVPVITAAFWIAKVLTTGMGETTSDYLVYNINRYVAVLLGAIGLAVGLVLQLRARRYIAWVYWLAVVMVAVFGTMAADVLHIGLGIPYAVSATFYAIVLAVVFVTWYRVEGTLSIHSIRTRRREGFYWATVLATFALGTAVGDLTATTFHWGYFLSGVVFAVAIAVPAVAYRWLRLDPVVGFWIAYVLTRPLGASFADWFAAPKSRRGLEIGFLQTSVVLTVLIAACVVYFTVTRRDVEEPAAAPSGTG